MGRILADTIIPPQYREAHQRGLAHYLATGEGPIFKTRIEIMAVHRQGHEFPVELTIAPLHDEDQVSFSAFIRDITQQQKTQQKLYHRAFHDALTDLPNRALFINHLERVIESSQENDDYLFAVLFLDLDRFKLINDSLGHLAGDQLLITIARRLETSVRSGDIVARLGGDEFAILLDDIKDIDAARGIATRIRAELSKPINLNGQEMFTTVSIGITTNHQKYLLPGDILRDADIAMYRAKTQGKDRYELFNRAQHVQAISRLQLETDLWQALERQELDVYYQPIISVTSSQILGVEAFLRWRHPQRGLLSPKEFILLAEETGLITPIGEWLLWRVCSQMQCWRREYPTLAIAINISAPQLRQPNIVPLISEVLRESGLPPQALTVEMRQGILSEAINPTVLAELVAKGIKISIDDFGIGSSLECLKNFPLNTLKIDQSFVKDITTSPDDRIIITALIGLAHALNLTVIAAGVETEAQFAFLQAQQCDGVQGYLFGKPMPAGDLTNLLKRTLFPLELGEG
jgi:diguanylate cyclase (GGDEF)-like protein